MAPRNPGFLSYDPEIFECRGPLLVHAVFPHTWHLRSEGGQILSVVDSRWNGPLTMRVATIPTRHRASPGMAATLTEAGLEVGTAVIPFEGARPWMAPVERSEALDLSLLRADLPSVRHKIQAASRGGLAIGEAAPSRASAPAWLVHGSVEMSSLWDALMRQDTEAVSRHAVGLLGLGPGLTPSGDDVLCGLIAGLSVLGHRSVRHQERCEGAVAALRACVMAEAPRRTTSLSATLLRSAAHGVAAEPLLQVLGTVGSGNQVKGIDEVLMLGHSSGSDMLTGALMACAMLVRWEEVFGTAMVGSR
jgi:hypothetical protein